jgi:DNA-binding NtrC family response regulator
MEHHTVLYIFYRADANSSVLAAIKRTGCEVVSTSKTVEAVALLYIMGQVAAVVLDSHAAENAGFNLAQSLSSIRPNVPVMLECGESIDNSPSSERCLSVDELKSAIDHVLSEESVA